MKVPGEVAQSFHSLLTSALEDGGESSATRPGHLIPGEITPSTNWIEDWVDPRADLDKLEDIKISLAVTAIEILYLGYSFRRLVYM
jgi:hypothetical protein